MIFVGGNKRNPVHLTILLFLCLFLALINPFTVQAGLKTANVLEADNQSMTISVQAPTENVGQGVTQLILVVNKEYPPQWFPEDGKEYDQDIAEYYAAYEGEHYTIVIEPSSNGQEHEVKVENLDMGTRYLFKPWFKYNDGGIKYVSSDVQFASDEFYRHQEVLNTISSELAKLSMELQKKKNSRNRVLPRPCYRMLWMMHNRHSRTESLKESRALS